MCTHPNCPEVQDRACGALWNVTYNNVENLKRIGALGLNCVLASMARHLGRASLQENALWLLWNLSTNSLTRPSLETSHAHASAFDCTKRAVGSVPRLILSGTEQPSGDESHQ